MRKLHDNHRAHCLKAVAHDNRALSVTHNWRRDGPRGSVLQDEEAGTTELNPLGDINKESTKR